MSNGRILIVEDDYDISNMLRIFFSNEGYHVEIAARGSDALENCRKKLPDLIVLDIMLPDMDGYDVCLSLRTTTRTSHIPIIFLTQKDERSDRIRGLELGADDYITKPFDVQELRLRVRNALKRVSQGSLTNPVTGLPEGAVVDEKLSEVLGKDGISLLFVSIKNMDAFREAYGFVASDDVLRAISFMIVNTMREVSRPEDFLGHLNSTDFILVVPPSNLAVLSEKLSARLAQSVEYFYPIRDRDRMSVNESRLGSRLKEIISLKDQFTTVDQVKAELMRLME